MSRQGSRTGGNKAGGEAREYRRGGKRAGREAR